MIAYFKKEETTEVKLRRLHRKKKWLLRQLSKRTGERLRPTTLDTETPEHWDQKAKQILATYWLLSKEATCLASQRDSQRISRLLKELDAGGPVSPEIQQWWWSRY